MNEMIGLKRLLALLESLPKSEKPERSNVIPFPRQYRGPNYEEIMASIEWRGKR